MPVYEFYCKKCNTIYNFLSNKVNTQKIPACPKCDNKRLERQVSIFASISSSKGDEGGGPMPDIDEAKMEKVIASLAGEAESINDDDPRQAADLMRKLSDAAGMKMGPAMEEALGRMEKGEDPEKVEAEMGDLLEGDDLFMMEAKKRVRDSAPKPDVDETLYDL